jgi:hypothetical protein
MSAKKHAHRILADFYDEVEDELDDAGYFELSDDDKKSIRALLGALGFGVGGALTTGILKKAMLKNREVWPIVWEEAVYPSLARGASEAASAYDLIKPEIGTALDLSDADRFMRQYYEQHSLKFVRSLSQTDVRRLRGYVWMERDKTPEEFAQAMKDRYVFDASNKRLEVIFRTEVHRAEEGGTHGFVGENGARWKRRIGRYVGVWPRETHRADIAVGWIPYGEVYPVTGEMFSGESEINCYCHDEYGFEKERPEE